MACTGTHHAILVKSFLTNGESVTANLRNFRNHFQLSRHNPVSDVAVVVYPTPSKGWGHGGRP